MFFFDTIGFILLLPAFLLAMLAQARVTTAMSKFSRVNTARGMSGSKIAEAILSRAGVSDVQIERLDANSGDHYDPRSKTIRLSAHVYDSSSVTAVAVAAHEAGHALQHSEAYTPLAMRNGIFPIVRFTSAAAIPLIFIGIMLGLGSEFAPILIDVGIIFFATTVLFHLITLPVEFNASGRAREVLEVGGYLNDEELRGARKVLGAAAMTYVAAAMVAAMQLLRFFLMSRRR